MNPGGVGIIYRPIRVGFRRINWERNCGETKYVMSSDLSVSISNCIEVQRSLTEDRTIWVMSCHVMSVCVCCFVSGIHFLTIAYCVSWHQLWNDYELFCERIGLNGHLIQCNQ